MKLFHYDGTLMQGLLRLGDLILLNLLFLLCSLPVVTLGASAAAMYTVAFHRLDGNGSSICRQFFAAFRANFKKATPEWLIMLALAALLYADFRILLPMDFTGKIAVEVLFVISLVLYLVTLLFLFPLQAYFENTVGGTLKNAFALGLARLPQSLLLLVLNGIPLIVFYFSAALFIRLIPLWLLLASALPAQLGARLFLRIFKKLTPNEEQ